MDIEVVGLSSKHVNVIVPSDVSALLIIAHASFSDNAVSNALEYTGVMCGSSVERIPLTDTLCVYGAAFPVHVVEITTFLERCFPSTYPFVAASPESVGEPNAVTLFPPMEIEPVISPPVAGSALTSAAVRLMLPVSSGKIPHTERTLLSASAPPAGSIQTG